MGTLAEPFAVLDTFVCGLARVEILKGGNVRLTYYTENQLADGTTEEVVVCKLVMSLECIPEARRRVNTALLNCAQKHKISGISEVAAVSH